MPAMLGKDEQAITDVGSCSVHVMTLPGYVPRDGCINTPGSPGLSGS